MKGKVIFAFLLGAGVGTAGAYYYFLKKYEKDIEEYEVNRLEYMRLDDVPTETSEESTTTEDIPDAEESEESIEEVIIKNSVLTESPDKPDIFDYAKLSLSKMKEDKPVEKSIDPVDGDSTPIDFKMRKVNVAEFEDLCYSYEMQELTLYQDGYVTDFKDEVVYKLKEMYPDARIDNVSYEDSDGTEHIYVAADYMMTVYDMTINHTNYKDIYPDEEPEEK